MDNDVPIELLNEFQHELNEELDAWKESMVEQLGRALRESAPPVVPPPPPMPPVFLPPAINVESPTVNTPEVVVNVSPTPITVQSSVVPAPLVNVTTPEVRVNVSPTPVTVNAKAGEVTVTLRQGTRRLTIERDDAGNMIGAIISDE